MAESVQELSVNALLNFSKLLSVILKVFLDHIEMMLLMRIQGYFYQILNASMQKHMLRLKFACS